MLSSAVTRAVLPFIGGFATRGRIALLLLRYLYLHISLRCRSLAIVMVIPGIAVIRILARVLFFEA